MSSQRTSDILGAGHIYTRGDLRQRFAIIDRTLETGVYRPPFHASVWLFVTELKSKQDTPYVDRLEGDRLLWSGQTAGRTDAVIQNHRALGLELCVFYRQFPKEYPKGAFKFLGPFRYLSHQGSHPTAFVLQRVP